MNYLAHAFLSGENEPLLVGNFIADGIRGNKTQHLAPGILEGVMLHRKIDTFTDSHPLNFEMRSQLHAKAGKYAGVILDIFYDHLLAKHWNKYASQDLQHYCNWCYAIIENNEQWLPEKTAFMLPYMKRDNWLYNYQFKTGIIRSLMGLSKRINTQVDLVPGGEFAFSKIELLENSFAEFFPELQEFVKNETKKNPA